MSITIRHSIFMNKLNWSETVFSYLDLLNYMAIRSKIFASNITTVILSQATLIFFNNKSDTSRRLSLSTRYRLLIAVTRDVEIPRRGEDLPAWEYWPSGRDVSSAASPSDSRPTGVLCLCSQCPDQNCFLGSVWMNMTKASVRLLLTFLYHRRMFYKVVSPVEW